MKSNFLFTDHINLLTGYRIATIDGQKAHTLRGFYEEIAKALAFPDYFGFNLDSLDELLNDLSWLKEDKIAVYVTSSEHFVEKERNPEKLETLLDMLDATAEDWKWHDEEEAEFPKKELKFVFSESKRMREVLDNQEVNYEVIK